MEPDPLRAGRVRRTRCRRLPCRTSPVPVAVIAPARISHALRQAISATRWPTGRKGEPLEAVTGSGQSGRATDRVVRGGAGGRLHAKPPCGRFRRAGIPWSGRPLAPATGGCFAQTGSRDGYRAEGQSFPLATYRPLPCAKSASTAPVESRDDRPAGGRSHAPAGKQLPRAEAALRTATKPARTWDIRHRQAQRRTAWGRLIWRAPEGLAPAAREAPLRAGASARQRRAGNPAGTKKPACGRLIWRARKGGHLPLAKHRFAQVRTPASGGPEILRAQKNRPVAG